MSEKKFRIVLEGHLDEKSMRAFCLKHHSDAVEASRGLITSDPPDRDTEGMLNYAASCFGSDISFNVTAVETSVEEVESWPFYVDNGGPKWEGWKMLYVEGVAIHPRVICVELNGFRAITMSESVDRDGFFYIGDVDRDDEDDTATAETVDEAIEAHKSSVMNTGFEGEFLLSKRKGSIAIWETEGQWPNPFTIILDTKTGDVKLIAK